MNNTVRGLAAPERWVRWRGWAISWWRSLWDLLLPLRLRLFLGGRTARRQYDLLKSRGPGSCDRFRTALANSQIPPHLLDIIYSVLATHCFIPFSLFPGDLL